MSRSSEATQDNDELMSRARRDGGGLKPGEPILTVERSLQEDNASGTPRCNLSWHARKIIGFEPLERVEVEIHADRVVIRPKETHE